MKFYSVFRFRFGRRLRSSFVALHNPFLKEVKLSKNAREESNNGKQGDSLKTLKSSENGDSKDFLLWADDYW